MGWGFRECGYCVVRTLGFGRDALRLVLGELAKVFNGIFECLAFLVPGITRMSCQSACLYLREPFSIPITDHPSASWSRLNV